MLFNWPKKKAAEKGEKGEKTEKPKKVEKPKKKDPESLYEYIAESCVDGELPEDFSLPGKAETGKIQFADGAADGIAFYHMTPEIVDGRVRDEITALIYLISDGKTEEADQALAAFAAKHTALSAVGPFQMCVLQNRVKLQADNLYRYGVDKLSHSMNIDEVKYGLILMELLNLQDEKVKDTVRTLGLSDEFTLFAVLIMQKWENANEEIFRLAKHVKGWGRIHAVERLEASTQEISDWLLHEGMKNRIHPSYLALTCFEKADVRERLQKTLSHEEFTDIGAILAAMLDEGPAEGISAVGDEILSEYLEHTASQTLDNKDYENIATFLRFAEEKNIPALQEQCSELMSAKPADPPEKAVQTEEGQEAVSSPEPEGQETASSSEPKGQETESSSEPEGQKAASSSETEGQKPASSPEPEEQKPGSSPEPEGQKPETSSETTGGQKPASSFETTEEQKSVSSSESGGEKTASSSEPEGEKAASSSEPEGEKAASSSEPEGQKMVSSSEITGGQKPMSSPETKAQEPVSSPEKEEAESLLICMEKEFDRHYFKVSCLMKEETSADQAIKLFTEKLPLRKMQTGAGEESADCFKLLMIVQELKDKIGKGEELLQAALQVPAAYDRHAAVAVLESWTKASGKPLKEISSILYGTLLIATPGETDLHIKERMEKLTT